MSSVRFLLLLILVEMSQEFAFPYNKLFSHYQEHLLGERKVWQSWELLKHVSPDL